MVTTVSTMLPAPGTVREKFLMVPAMMPELGRVISSPSPVWMRVA